MDSHNWQSEFSKSLELFLRSFGDPAQATDWLAILTIYGPVPEGSPSASADIERFLEGIAAHATGPVEIRPWKDHPEMCIPMQSAHHCSLMLVQAIWNTVDHPAENHDGLVAAFTKRADQADYSEWLRLAAKVGIERARMVPIGTGTAPGAVPHDFIPTDLQAAILKALKGRALRLDPLAVLVSNGDTSRLYRAGGLRELRAAGLVKHKPGVGFYLPGFSPL
jgi:hypothetical protein